MMVPSMVIVMGTVRGVLLLFLVVEIGMMGLVVVMAVVAIVAMLVW